MRREGLLRPLVKATAANDAARLRRREFNAQNVARTIRLVKEFGEMFPISPEEKANLLGFAAYRHIHSTHIKRNV